ncbi:MAG: hypothetical protein V7K85_00430 [Nostoc sp.]
MTTACSFRVTVLELVKLAIAYFRCLMFQAATIAGISWLRFGFTSTLSSFRRGIADFHPGQQRANTLFFSKLIIEI